MLVYQIWVQSRTLDISRQAEITRVGTESFGLAKDNVKM